MTKVEDILMLNKNSRRTCSGHILNDGQPKKHSGNPEILEVRADRGLSRDEIRAYA